MHPWPSSRNSVRSTTLVGFKFHCSFSISGIDYWEFFTRLGSNKEKVSCNRCGNVLSYAKQSPTAMQHHLEHHENTDSSSSSKLVRGRRVQKIPVTKELKDWFIASLCTVMNVRFLHLSHPLYRCLFEMAGFGTVNADFARKCTDREHEKSRKLLAKDFRELKGQGITFTLITDEWTNPQGERFVAVILRRHH